MPQVPPGYEQPQVVQAQPGKDYVFSGYLKATIGKDGIAAYQLWFLDLGSSVSIGGWLPRRWLSRVTRRGAGP